MPSILVRGCKPVTTSLCDLGVTFDLGPATVLCTATFQTYFSYHKTL